MNSSSEVASDYAQELDELGFNSKPIITTLTIIAGENIQVSQEIVDVIVNRVYSLTDPAKILPVLYLMDSIVKNIGQSYITLFAPYVTDMTCYAFEKADEPTKQAIQHLVGTWAGIFPGREVDTINRRLSTKRGSIHLNPKFFPRPADGWNPSVPHGKPSVPPKADPRLGRQTNDHFPENKQFVNPPGTIEHMVPQPSIVQMELQQQSMDLSMSSVETLILQQQRQIQALIDEGRSPTPTQYALLQKLQHLYDLQRVHQDQARQKASPTFDPPTTPNFPNINTMNPIDSFQGQNWSNQPSNMNSVPFNLPSPADFINANSDIFSLPHFNRNNPSQSQPQFSVQPISNPNQMNTPPMQLSQNMQHNQALQHNPNVQPVSPIQPQPFGMPVQQPGPNQSYQGSQQLQSQPLPPQHSLNQHRQPSSNIPPSPPQNQNQNPQSLSRSDSLPKFATSGPRVPRQPPNRSRGSNNGASQPPPSRRYPAQPSQRGFPSGQPSVRSPVPETKRRDDLISSLYYNLKIQCQNCGIRFSDREKLEKHLDWHFRMNRREKEKNKKSFSRSWFLPPDDWVHFETAENEKTATPFFEATDDPEEEEVDLPCVPVDETQDRCNVCREKFEQFWDLDQEEWMFRDALKHPQTGLLCHTKCSADVSNQNSGSSLISPSVNNENISSSQVNVTDSTSNSFLSTPSHLEMKTSSSWSNSPTPVLPNRAEDLGKRNYPEDGLQQPWKKPKVEVPELLSS